MAIELKSTPEITIAFLNTLPGITYIKDPAFAQYEPSSNFDIASIDRISNTFRRVFSFFESIYATPMTFRDPIALFRLFKLKLQKIAEAFGLETSFVMQYIFDETPRKGLAIDTDLFSVISLLLLFAIKHFGLENHTHIVFMTVDRCPAVCLHFRIDSNRYKESVLLKFAEAICKRNEAYFKTAHGALAQKESEKIPGIGHMIRNDRYSAFGDHSLTLFSPIKRDWSDYVNHSPIFRLPEKFFEGFP